MNKTILLYTLWVGCLMFIAACSIDRDPCMLPKQTITRIGSYTVDTAGNTIDTLLPKPLLIAISKDTLRGLRFADKSSKLSMVLSSVADTCRYMIVPDSSTGVADTMTFYYQRSLHFLSNSCGYSYFFLLKNITTTTYAIDSVKINNAEVNNDANTPEHVKVYY